MVISSVEEKITLLPGQSKILANFKDPILAAIAGCVAGDTLIDIPRGKRRIDKLCGWHEVMSWTGTEVKPAISYIFHKGRACLNKITTESGNFIEATKRHYLLTFEGRTLRWRSVGEIKPMLSGQKAVFVVSVKPYHVSTSQLQEDSPYLQVSSSALCRSVSGVDARNCFSSFLDYRDCYFEDCRLYGGLSLQVKDNALKHSPLPAGVLLSSPENSHKDDSGLSPVYNRVCQSSARRSKSSLTHQHGPSQGEIYHASPYTCVLSPGLFLKLSQGHKLTSAVLSLESLNTQSLPVSNYVSLPSVHPLCLLYLDRIVEIKETRADDYYDMFVPEYHNYLARGMIHHNTGGGKTVTGYWWLHSRMEAYPGFTWGMAEPTWQMLDKVILNSSDPDRPTLEQYFQKVGHHPSYAKGERIMRTDFGNIYLYTAENPNSMQGAPLRGFWLDEGGQMSLLAHQTALQRISMMQGQELITTTPYNLGWLLTDIVNKQGQGIAVERWRSIDRPGYPRERYEYMRQQLPAWRFAMLYDAQFEKPAGLIYSMFNESVCVIDRFPINKSWLIYSGHDFGPDNPAALFVAQDPATGNFYHFAEYLPGPGVSVHERVEAFKNLTKDYNVIKRVGGSPAEEETRQAYNAHGWIITAPKIKHIEPQIDKVVGMHQLNKIFAFRDLVNYLDEKRTFSRKLNDMGQPTEDIENESRFHLMACERYLLSEFAPETALTGNAPQTTHGVAV
jgi:hypothetical protein